MNQNTLCMEMNPLYVLEQSLFTSNNTYNPQVGYYPQVGNSYLVPQVLTNYGAGVPVMSIPVQPWQPPQPQQETHFGPHYRTIDFSLTVPFKPSQPPRVLKKQPEVAEVKISLSVSQQTVISVKEEMAFPEEDEKKQEQEMPLLLPQLTAHLSDPGFLLEPEPVVKKEVKQEVITPPTISRHLSDPSFLLQHTNVEVEEKTEEGTVRLVDTW